METGICGGETRKTEQEGLEIMINRAIHQAWDFICALAVILLFALSGGDPDANDDPKRYGKRGLL